MTIGVLKMVNFKSKIGKTKTVIIDPIQIYDSLDRKSDKGPLRPIQIEVLKKWNDKFIDKKDVVLKLHTGQGKTIVGLLVLQSMLNRKNGPAIYICPNIYLVQQTCEQADSFGIKYCVIGEDNQLPDEFINEESILITHAQKLFNGLTKFNLGARGIEIGTIILDDSHACISVIENAFKISIKNNRPAYQEILELFREDLVKQGVGTFADIKSKVFDAFLKVPYWAWSNKNDEISTILSKYSSSNEVKFAWPLIKDNLNDCQCIISGDRLEIKPYFNFIDMFGSFTNAKSRIFMSATLNDDSFFVKSMGLDPNVINEPLISDSEKWSGEKMILIPSLLDSKLDRTEVVNFFARPDESRKVGYVSLVPSTKSTADWAKYEANITNSDNIYETITKLKNKEYDKTVVIVNRYDGIDLPDESCRVLIIDSLPYLESLEDLYISSCIGESVTVTSRISQIIEQGLGRGVRGEKDYCVIVITGADLTRILRNKRLRDNFSDQTKLQIEIGEEIAEFAKEEIENGKEPIDAFKELVNQSINRDEGWKEFYVDKMNDLKEGKKSGGLIQLYQLLYNAENAYRLNDNRCLTIMDEVIQKFATTEKEQGWYLQEKARYAYKFSKSESKEIQTQAYNHNRFLLKLDTIAFTNSLESIDIQRVSKIKEWLNQFEDHKEMALEIDNILQNLEFGVTADKFEESMNTLGEILGFGCSRPDKEYKEGPDNLWKIDNNSYLLFECKNNVKLERDKVGKSETGQMNNSCAWFENNVTSSRVKNIMIINTRLVDSAAGFNKEVFVMKKGKLKKLVNNTKNFFKELYVFNLHDINDKSIQTLLQTHKLDTNYFFDNEYTETFRQI